MEREALRQGIDFAKSHPGYEVQLVFEKAYNMYRSDDDALPWIGGGWIDASKAPWLQGSWVQSLDKVGTPVVTIPPAAERNWRDLANGFYFWVLLMAAVGVFSWFSIVTAGSWCWCCSSRHGRRCTWRVHPGLAIPRAAAAAAGAVGSRRRGSRVERREGRRSVASRPALARRIDRSALGGHRGPPLHAAFSPTPRRHPRAAGRVTATADFPRIRRGGVSCPSMSGDSASRRKERGMEQAKSSEGLAPGTLAVLAATPAVFQALFAGQQGGRRQTRRRRLVGEGRAGAPHLDSAARYHRACQGYGGRRSPLAAGRRRDRDA